MECAREIRKRLGAIDLVPGEDSIRLLSDALIVALSKIQTLSLEEEVQSLKDGKTWRDRR